MRRLFSADEAAARGLTRAALRWGEQQGRWRRVDRGIYAEGPDDPTPLDRARATVLRTGGVAGGTLAGVLHGLDAVQLGRTEVVVENSRSGRSRGVRRRQVDPGRVVVVGGLTCADGTRTLIDLAATLSDLKWEQALESALRKGLTTIAELASALPELSRARTPGTPRIRRVLALRPRGAPATESLLETLMVQLARTARGVPDPARQWRVEDAHGIFVARVDLAWPDLGLFVELDGEHHRGQPVYDANRETAVVAAMGWLCGRFTWTEVVHHAVPTARRLAAVASQARRRPRHDHEPGSLCISGCDSARFVRIAQPKVHDERDSARRS